MIPSAHETIQNTGFNSEQLININIDFVDGHYQPQNVMVCSSSLLANGGQKVAMFLNKYQQMFA